MRIRLSMRKRTIILGSLGLGFSICGIVLSVMSGGLVGLVIGVVGVGLNCYCLGKMEGIRYLE